MNLDSKLGSKLMFEPNHKLYQTSKFFTYLGDVAIIAPLCIGGIIFGLVLRHHQMIILGLSVFVVLTLSWAIKILLKRQRPTGQYRSVLPGDQYSFPSGHATGAMATYGGLMILVGSNQDSIVAIGSSVGLGFVVFFVGLSRVALGYHHPSDVLAGWTLGGLALLAVANF